MVTENPSKLASTLDILKDELAKPSRLRSLQHCVEVVKTLSQDSNTAEVEAITNVILKDMNLTTRVLKVANSIEFNRSGKRITTVSQAIMMLGLSPIRTIACSVMLLEQLPSQAQVKTIKNICIISALGGAISKLLAEKSIPSEAEHGFIAGAFVFFGKLMAMTFLPSLFSDYEMMVKQGIEEPKAQVQVFGAGFERIGKDLGEYMNLPKNLTAYMDPTHIPDRDMGHIDEKLLSITRTSLNICRQLEKTHRAEDLERILSKMHGPKEANLGHIDMLQISTEAARDIATIYKNDLNVPVWQTLNSVIEHQDEEIASLDKIKEKEKEEAKAHAELEKKKLGKGELEEEIGINIDVFLDGVATVTALLADPKSTRFQVLAAIAEIIYLGFVAKNVVVARRHDEKDALVGAAAYGANAYAIRESLYVVLEPSVKELPNIALQAGRDIYIEDIEKSKFANFIPRWIRDSRPGAFLLLPIKMDDHQLGLIYVDGPKLPEGGAIPPEVQRELKILRNMAAMAFRLSN